MTRFRETLPIFMIAGLYILPGPHPAAAAPASRTIEVRGVKIHYLIEGKGEPVLLIHGLHSSAAMNWVINGVFSELAKDHQVIALDLPGHGRSDKPANEQAYGLQIVADCLALLDELKIDKAHIVGYSLGGMVAIKLLVLHPERARSATIGGMGWLREGSRLQRIWEQLPAREGSRTPAAFLHSIGKFAVTEQELKKIAVPVEVVIGDRDPVQRMYVAPLRPVRPDWPVVEIGDAGHMNCIVKPQFREEIVAWLRKNGGK